MGLHDCEHNFLCINIPNAWAWISGTERSGHRFGAALPWLRPCPVRPRPGSVPARLGPGPALPAHPAQPPVRPSCAVSQAQLSLLYKSEKFLGHKADFL